MDNVERHDDADVIEVNDCVIDVMGMTLLKSSMTSQKVTLASNRIKGDILVLRGSVAKEKRSCIDIK